MNTKTLIANSIYFSAVFLVALGISSFAFARKVNLYRNTAKSITLTVEKDTVSIKSSVEGVVQQMHVNRGDHVQEGDLIATLQNPVQEARLQTLQQYADDNISAKTQAELINSEQDAYAVKATKAGTVDEISISEGGSVSTGDVVLTLFADQNTHLTTQLDLNQIQNLQRQKALTVHNVRLDSFYQAKFSGLRQAQADKNDFNQYQVIFSIDEEDSSSLLDGEVVFVTNTNDSPAQRPSDIITDSWNQILQAPYK